MPGILYQTEGEGKRARWWRDSESVCEREREAEHCREMEIASAIKYTIKE